MSSDVPRLFPEKRRANTMYRYLLPLLLCQTVVAAPQAIIDSDITYVKLQPTIEAPTAPSHYRESRIENLPLTIPGNVTLEVNRNLTERNYSATENTDTRSSEDEKLESASLIDNSDVTLPESSNLSEITALPEGVLPEGATLQDTAVLIDSFVPARTEPETNSTKTDLSEQILPEENALTEITVPESTLLDKTANPEQTLPQKTVKREGTMPEITETERDELLEADVSDTIPSETIQSERRGRTYESSETTDIFEEPTERYEDITQIPEIVAPRTRATPIRSKFVPKLSYFQKPQVFVSSRTNSIEKSAKRRFRSNCRCEKIWNCPKLQISVPRCPNEYFLCCF